jgi:FlaA1/EpsC-like NDP-sugar epimerase
MSGPVTGVFSRPGVQRGLAFFVFDVVLLAAAIVFAFMLRFAGEVPGEYRSRLGLFIVLSVALKIPVLHLFHLYRISWTYVSFHELLDVFKATSVGSLLYSAVLLIGLRETAISAGFPRTVLVLDYVLTLLFIGALRSGKRIYAGLARGRGDASQRVLIVGAGSAGEMLLREFGRNEALRYRVVGLVDDDARKAGLSLHGVRVLGDRHTIPELVQDEDVDEIVIAMPSVRARSIADIVSICKRTPATVKILPAIYSSLVSEIRVGHVREIRIEDLLPRRPVHIDVTAVSASIRGECILVTGAGGSIGSELCRQIARLDPERLLLLGNVENDIFAIEAELRQMGVGPELVPLIGDVRHAEKVEHIFRRFGPSVVFHAAAHKHVLLMEANPDEAVLNNISGTKIIAEACDRHGVARMVFISTDKAVNPMSVMGASKRFAELIVRSFVPKSQTRFMIVRFGNVLDSTGSVVPVFRKQIARGGPVTITDPAMTRYFMTIPEAVHLVIQAFAMGRGGEVFVLDMGDPVRIIDLAENLIRLSGFEPYRDIEIKVIGARQGEKIHEEAFFQEEAVERTAHDHIFVAEANRQPDAASLESELKELLQLAGQMDGEAIRRKLHEAVASFSR